MQIIRDIAALRKAVEELRGSDGGEIAFVPTMGALHAGHLRLVEEGRRRAGHVIASIFVNPLQFGEGEDLDRYPRREEADLALLEEAGCALAWLPCAQDLYPTGFATRIRVSSLGDRWEGEARPGHFEGVATIVAKLLIAAGPDLALFGEKDFQQLAVIRRMVADLGLPVEIVPVPTVRDADGLALSSRNAYLSAEQRKRALALPRGLERARDRIAGGAEVGAVIDETKAALREAGFEPVDYVALIDSQTLEPTNQAGPGLRLVAAASLGGTRLIDNIPFGENAIPAR